MAFFFYWWTQHSCILGIELFGACATAVHYSIYLSVWPVLCMIPSASQTQTACFVPSRRWLRSPTPAFSFSLCTKLCWAWHRSTEQKLHRHRHPQAPQRKGNTLLFFHSRYMQCNRCRCRGRPVLQSNLAASLLPTHVLSLYLTLSLSLCVCVCIQTETSFLELVGSGFVVREIWTQLSAPTPWKKKIERHACLPVSKLGATKTKSDNVGCCFSVDNQFGRPENVNAYFLTLLRQRLAGDRTGRQSPLLQV